MPSPKKTFEHLYRDGLKELKSNQDRNKLELKDAQVPKTPAGTPQVHAIILEQYDRLIDDVIKGLDFETPSPELVLKKGLAALRRIEQFRFLLENLLEAVKRDDSLQNSLLRYKELNLIDFELPPNLAEETRQSPWPSMFGAGGLLKRALKRLADAALTVIEMVTNAMSLVPRFASIKPKASIGLTGPVPTFSVQVEFEADMMALHELFRVMTAGE